MEGGDGADGARAGVVVNPLAAGLHDAVAGRQQGLGRGIAERHQHVGIDQFDLPPDERQADLGFLRGRRPVAGRPPRNHVGDIGLAAIDPDGCDHPVQQFAGTADERQSLDILFAPGRLADEHDARLRVAVGEHQPRCGVFQRAAVEVFEKLPQHFQRGRGSRRLAGGGNSFVRRQRQIGSRGRRDRCRNFPCRSWRRDLAGGGGNGNAVRLGQPVDRRVAKRAIDPGLQIKGQQLLHGRRWFGHEIHYANLSRTDRPGAKRLTFDFHGCPPPKNRKQRTFRSLLNRAGTLS